MPAKLPWPVERDTYVCLASCDMSKYMSVHGQYVTQTKSLSMYWHSYWSELQSLSYPDMAGISKTATHAVSQPKWTPHRGESADVITRLLCDSGTV